MKIRPARSLSLLTVILTFAACGGEAADTADESAPAAEPAAEQAMASVEITSPMDGDTIDGPSVTVTLAAHGFQVVPAGDTTPNSGHHHLFLDRDVSAPDVPIPAEEGFIVHMGTGVSEFTFEAVAPGDHVLIAVVGDAVHVPLDPPLRDTVRFVVR